MVKNLKYRMQERHTYIDSDANLDALMHYSGIWSAGTYRINEVVGHQGGLYVCIVESTTSEPATTNTDWNLLSYIPQSAVLFEAPANFSPGASYTAIQNWPESDSYGVFDDPDPVTGIITVPLNGLYRVNAQVIFQQGNTNKELACLLWVRSSLQGDFVIDSIQISDDKTDWRSVGATFQTNASAGETFQIGLSRVNQSMGTCSFQPSTFEVETILTN